MTHKCLWCLFASALFLTIVSTAGSQDNQQPARTPYPQWKHGPFTRAEHFPIAVWLQSPKNAARYKAAGINLYVGLWEGPTEEQLSALKAAGMPVICEQNKVGLAHKDDPTIVGWMHGDEPDNAQPVTDPKTGKQTYGPFIAPEKIVTDYERLRKGDPTRPILLNLGQGVANDAWVGRGSGAKLDDYKTYVKGGDIVSFDVYPVAGLEKPDSENYLWYVPKGVERLVNWSEGKKTIWNCIECTRIGSTRKATPEQVRAEVWMALIHGSRGLIYFVHEFAPKFNEWALLDDPPMLEAVTAINKQIQNLASVLNSPTITDAVTVTSSNEKTPIATMVKRYGGATYLFAVGMRNEATRGIFKLKDVPANTKAEVFGESRTLTVRNGTFEEDFRPYDVHIYRIR